MDRKVIAMLSSYILIVTLMIYLVGSTGYGAL